MMPDGWNYVAPPKPSPTPNPSWSKPKFLGAKARKAPVKHNRPFQWEDTLRGSKPLVSYQYPEPWPPKLVSDGGGDPAGNHDLFHEFGRGSKAHHDWSLRHYEKYIYIKGDKPRYCNECGFDLDKSDLTTSRKYYGK